MAALTPVGIRENSRQILQQLLQVLLVGMTIGMMRNVVPALAEAEFGVPRGSFLLLVSFVVAFGVVKGAMNFVAGRLAERLGRRRVLIAGWIVAMPIPVLIHFAGSWWWIVLATVLLGVNQGLTWSMTQTMKLDLTRADQRGLVLGLNEFSGYTGLAIAGILTGYAATLVGPREGLLAFGATVIALATILAWWQADETFPWAQAQDRDAARPDPDAAGRPREAARLAAHPTNREVFAQMSWRDRRLAALCQAGLVEKFVDALVWVVWPLYLHQRGVSLPGIGWIVGVYGFTWGISQLVTGRMSDRIGRHRLNTFGMWTCGAGVAMMPIAAGTFGWTAAAAVTGFGMAMLYPNLSAAVADIAQPGWRASAIGIYRFWRDLGYAIGALGMGLVALWGGQLQTTFWFVALAMLLSGLVLHALGEETHPGLRRVPR
ncbi:MAG TPA: MFS transporter [Burkholderiaceae bacterium]|nr:MFS transporter [Burkholderiaceae bacterium]